MSTDLTLVHSDDAPIYHRLPDEPLEAYEAFVEWCKIPRSSRNLGNFLRRTAYPQKLIRKLMKEWYWEDRATAFDNDSVALQPDPRSMDEEAAIAGQMAAAQFFLDLGMRSMELKNPALISADKAMKLVEKGVEIQRRALGQADINVQFTVDDMTRVNKMLDDIGMLDEAFDIEDAIIVDEPEKVPVELDDEVPM